MEYLKINPTQILKKYTTSRDFGYNCFDILDKNIPIQVFYAYFNHIVEYKLKNIWNHIILQWITMQNTMESKNRKDYLKDRIKNKTENILKKLKRLKNYG